MLPSHESKSILFSIILFTCFAAGCQILPEQWQATILKELPQVNPEVLFQDDFSNSKGEWIVKEDQSGFRRYAEGEFVFHISSPEVNAWSYPKGLKFEDVRIEVRASRESGDTNNLFGILCRYQDEANFYQLLVSSDGYYDISKVSGRQRIPLIAKQLLPSEAIPRDSQQVFLIAECIGESLVLSVNGIRIAEAYDSEFKSGNIGLIAGAFQDPGVEIHFDDLVVRRP